MAVERVAATTSVADVLDRVLDKGIVIDAWVRVSLVGITVITVEARIVVASIETHLRHADLATQRRLWSLPALEPVAAPPPQFDRPAADISPSLARPQSRGHHSPPVRTPSRR